jgi:hypothetical protein
MSHNSFTINGGEPNANTEITVPANNVIRIGQGLSAAYSGSGGSLAVGSDLFFYDSDPLNLIADATLNGAGGWYSSVTLPAGKYLMRAYFSALFSATGIMGYRFRVASTEKGSGAYIGGTTNVSYDGGSFASIGLTLTSTTTISVRVHTATNVSAVASQGNVPAEESWLLVEKLA